METKLDKGYTDNLPLWAQVRAAIRGKQGAIKLLDGNCGYYGLVSPAYRETVENYKIVDKRRKSYFARGRFFNATGRTHDAYVGMVGAKPVETEVPEGLTDLMESVDGENSTINDFALEIASELLVTGRYGVLVDPPSNEGKTRSQMQPAKLIGYNAEAMPHHVVSGGKLVLVDLLELYWEKEGDEYECKEQVRRLELIEGVYTSKIKRDGDWESIVQPTIDNKTLDYIPFQFFGSEQNKPIYDRPVMFDLAHENMGHFQLSCDNLENLHYHGQGMTNVYSSMDIDQFNEMNPNGLDVGAKGVNMLEQGDKVEILQIAATGAISAEMERVEKRMIMLGAQVTQDASTNQTLGAKEIESNASTSQLKRIAVNTSKGLQWCIEQAALFMGISGEINVKVNDQFVTDDMTAQDVQSVFQAVQGGSLPQSVLLNTARKAGYTDKTNEELIEELNEEGATGESEELAQLRMENDNLREQLNGATE
ncbi:coil containing protein [Vibrio phage 1.144.O._10N.286.45.B3]|nr:coil containing protein [Vibrio phage 1.144.O._10N.286.45.B3]